ncbi:MAG: helix-turn-helix domain-containing protein [Verrucomicrobia bacterium]|nr:MAG: helix-turn-helix domain-containing protein [Verrucomicrobiota bacterium]
MSDKSVNFDHALFEKVLKSDLLATYQHAFRSATGLPLRLVNADVEHWCLDDDDTNRSPFCVRLNLCKTACQSCVDVNTSLMKEAAVSGPTSCHCFAGLKSTTVPVRYGNVLVGFLKTGQIFNQIPAPSTFDQVAKTLKRQGLTPKNVEALREAYFQTRVLQPERYQSMVTLLATFAEQLGTQAEKISTAHLSGEPAAIAKAKQFIEENLTEPLPLAKVARTAGLSESHFCRVFRDVTGLTLTDFINRRRIQWAQHELLKRDARISEIAFMIGYQSLSQFNRSFARVTGRSPTQFRNEELMRIA